MMFSSENSLGIFQKFFRQNLKKADLPLTWSA